MRLPPVFTSRPGRPMRGCQRWVGYPEAFHADMPPRMLATEAKPRWRKKLAAMLERYPLLQITAVSVFGSRDAI